MRRAPGGQPTRFGIPVQHQCTAAQAGGLRLDQAQHGLGGDGGVDGAPAGAQHGQPGLGRHRMGGDDHLALRLGRQREAQEQQD